MYRRISRTNYVPRLPVNFKFVLYWSISVEEDMKGLELPLLTQRICQKHDVEMFELKLRISHGKVPKDISSFNTRVDEKMLRDISR